MIDSRPAVFAARSGAGRPGQGGGIIFRGLLLIVLAGSVGSGLAAPPAGNGDQASAERILHQARSDFLAAKDLGARKYLPRGYEEVADRLRQVEDLVVAPSVADHEKVRAVTELAIQAERLLARARFVKEVRNHRNSWEAALTRFDQALAEVALAGRVTLDPSLSGPAAARALIDSLGGRRLANRVQVDSLTLALQDVEQRLRTVSAERDSAVTSLQVEVSHLRRQLWDTELRAGIAEADRSAVESDLNQRRERDLALQQIEQDFGPDEAEVLLTPAGDLIVRVFGFSFAVGSAELAPASLPLVDKLARTVQLFPGRQLLVDGHTDDTGSREANLRLSRRRAETVALLLSERLDLPADAIATNGHGPDRPLATNSTPAGRARNRRIDLIIRTEE